MSRKRISKGQSLEEKHSKRIHTKSQPLLIYSKVLRDIGAGQVDMAGVFYEKNFNEKIIKIFEVKSFAYLSHQQRKRLLHSAQFLSGIMGLSCRISVIFDDF